MDTDGHRSGEETAEYAEHAERGKGGCGLLRFAWVGFVVLVLYVLSTGPVTKFGLKHPSTLPAISTVYSPFAFLGNRWAPVRTFFDWYVNDLWKANDPSTEI